MPRQLAELIVPRWHGVCVVKTHCARTASMISGVTIAPGPQGSKQFFHERQGKAECPSFMWKRVIR